VESLAEALGFTADQPVLILSADLAGSTHAATAATLTAMRNGSATTATLMMPGPWSRHAVDQFNHSAHANDDVGLHLTLNAELDCFRWGPLTHAPSLLDGDGGFAPSATCGTTPISKRFDANVVPRSNGLKCGGSTSPTSPLT